MYNMEFYSGYFCIIIAVTAWCFRTSECTCSTPSAIENADEPPSGKQYETDETYRYLCKRGYQGVGHSFIVCQADGTWVVRSRDDTDQRLVVCNKVSCNNPPDVPNATPVGTDYFFGDTITYNCNRGFQKKSGNGVTLCQASGKWTSPTLICEEGVVSCNNPPDVPNATPVGTDYFFEDTVTYNCNRGFRRKSGNGVTLCQASGKWTSPTLICEEIPVKTEVSTAANPDNGPKPIASSPNLYPSVVIVFISGCAFVLCLTYTELYA